MPGQESFVFSLKGQKVWKWGYFLNMRIGMDFRRKRLRTFAELSFGARTYWEFGSNAANAPFETDVRH